MLSALEPRPRGKAKTPQREIDSLKAEKRQLERELRRQQSLLRAANRAVGLPAKGASKASSKGRGRKRRGSRGRTVLETLRREETTQEGAGDGAQERDGGPGGDDAGES